MEPELRKALAEAVRLWAKPTTPEDLAARGARVRTIQLRLLPELIEKAVNRTLLARTIDENGDTAGVGKAAREEFMRLLRETPPEEREAEDSEPVKSLTTLERIKARLSDERSQLLADEAELQQREKGTEVAQSSVGLESALRRMLVRGGGEGAGNQAGEVLEVVKKLVGAERDRVQRKEIDRRKVEMSRLERRLDKVCRQLEESESALKRLLELSKTDPGLKSMHRDVQGLDLDDNQFTLKSAWLEKIFKENT
ncbi:MAG: hypothetical protein ACI841_003186 [Planctomycetota bacterium]|jgi:hypothetical protein